MPNFAVIDGENVINTIVADSKTIAEQITGKKCIEFTLEDRAEAGGTFIGKTFIPRKPFNSWVLNGFNEWEAPVSYPGEGIYEWDETTVSWIPK